MAFAFSALALQTPAEERRLFETVDGVSTKGEFIDTNPKTKERLYIRYSPIADLGVELELTAGDSLIWREHIQPLGVSHSKYRNDVSVRVENGKIFVISVGAKRILEVRDLKTGKQLSREIAERLTRQNSGSVPISN